MAYEKKVWVDKVTPLSAANMNNIEEGIANLDRVMGTYTGDNSASRNISLGFRPSAVLIIPYLNNAYSKGIPVECYSASASSSYTYGYIYGGSFIDGVSALTQLISNSITVSTTPLTIISTGFIVYKEEVIPVLVPETGDYLDIVSVTNGIDYSYRYIAFR